MAETGWLITSRHHHKIDGNTEGVVLHSSFAERECPVQALAAHHSLLSDEERAQEASIIMTRGTVADAEILNKLPGAIRRFLNAHNN